MFSSKQWYLRTCWFFRNCSCRRTQWRHFITFCKHPISVTDLSLLCFYRYMWWQAKKNKRESTHWDKYGGLYTCVKNAAISSVTSAATDCLLSCQVLLPMPGNTVKYPENAMGTWYQERLARDGLEDCRFRVSSLKLNLPGCYRPLLAFLHNLSYTLQRAASGEGAGEMTGNSSRKSDGHLNVTAIEGKQDSLTLTLNFDLDTSCYATICLREIMKCDP